MNSVDEVGAAADPSKFNTSATFSRNSTEATNTFYLQEFLPWDVLITYAYGYVITDDLAAAEPRVLNITSFNQIAFRKHQKQWTTPGQTDATGAGALHACQHRLFRFQQIHA